MPGSRARREESRRSRPRPRGRVRVFTRGPGIRAGVIWANDYHRIDPASPWGGFKMSGTGRENGLEAIRQYTEVKSVWVGLEDRPIHWYDDGGTQRLN